MGALVGYCSVSFLYATAASRNSFRAIIKSANCSAVSWLAVSGAPVFAACDAACMCGAKGLGSSLDCTVETTVRLKRRTPARIANRLTFMAKLLYPNYPGGFGLGF